MGGSGAQRRRVRCSYIHHPCTSSALPDWKSHPTWACSSRVRLQQQTLFSFRFQIFSDCSKYCLFVALAHFSATWREATTFTIQCALLVTDTPTGWAVNTEEHQYLRSHSRTEILYPHVCKTLLLWYSISGIQLPLRSFSWIPGVETRIYSFAVLLVRPHAIKIQCLLLWLSHLNSWPDERSKDPPWTKQHRTATVAKKSREESWVLQQGFRHSLPWYPPREAEEVGWMSGRWSG